MTRSFIWLSFLLVPFLATSALRQPCAYQIETWAGENGLPQNSVTTMAQTRDGYLWLGTFGGLARFDGSKFKVFDVSTTPQLPSTRVLSLFEDALGAFWIGTEEGFVCRILGGKVQVFRPPNRGSVSRFIKTFAQTKRGELWMMSAEGQLLRYGSDQFTVVSTNWNLKGDSVKTLTIDSSGQLWVGTERELAFWDKDRFVNQWDDSCEAHFSVAGLSPGKTGGGVWVAGNGRLRRFQNGKWTSDLGAYPWEKGVLSEMHEDRRGQLWLGVYGSGLYRYGTNGVSLKLSEEEGLPGNLIRSLLEDFEGNIWVGTDGHGLARVKPSVFQSYGREQGLSSDLVLSVCEGNEGELWIGTNGEGINRLKDGVIQHYGIKQGLLNECVWSVCEDKNRTLWAGTWGGGLFYKQGDTFVPFSGPGPRAPVVRALYEDSKGSLWIGQFRGGPELTALKSNRKEFLDLPQQFRQMETRAILEEASGALWLGTRDDGLYRISHGTQVRYGTNQGLSSESIFSLYSDAEGTLWIGTGNGLNRLQRGKIATFTTRQGLANPFVLSITEDNHRNLWCGSVAGVFRVNKDDLDKTAGRKSGSFPCAAFSRADGLPTLECSSGCQPTGCKTRDGRLWFATVNGLAVVDPEKVPFNFREPPVLIDEVVVEHHQESSVYTVPAPQQFTAGGFTREYSYAPVFRIPPGKPRFEFHYTALSLTAPEKVRFRYKLENLEETWVDAGTERKAHYSYLAPGHYKFRVQACNNDGVWNEKGASLAVIILPHFWQTWWFRFLMLTALLLLFAAAYEVRLALERRVTRLRLRMARDLHDEVGSNLGTIALLGEVVSKRPAGSAEEVSELRRVAVQTIESLRDIVWFLDPAADKMSELVLRMKDTARTMLRETTFEFSSKGEDAAPTPSLDLRRNIFPMFKEILHNIARHSRATRVEIQINITPREFQLSVKDNGVGFDPSRMSGGNGLRNLRRRAVDLKGEVRIESVAGKGTCINVKAHIP